MVDVERKAKELLRRPELYVQGIAEQVFAGAAERERMELCSGGGCTGGYFWEKLT